MIFMVATIVIYLMRFIRVTKNILDDEDKNENAGVL